MDEYTSYKHPDSDLDFGRNWGENPNTKVSGWLNGDEIIINSTWEISSLEEADITLVEGDQGTSISANGKITSIFLAGGTNGVQYILANNITTKDSSDVIRKETKEALLNCKRGC